MNTPQKIALFLLFISSFSIFSFLVMTKNGSISMGKDCDGVVNGVVSRSFGTVRPVKVDGGYHWELNLVSYNEFDGFYYLKKMDPMLRGVSTPVVIKVGRDRQTFTSELVPEAAISISSDDSFAYSSSSNFPEFVDGLFPVVGNSEVIQVSGKSQGRVSHKLEDGIGEAVDIKAKMHTPVRAFRSGTVVYAEGRFPDAGCDSERLLRSGNKIILLDDEGFEVVYGHLAHDSIHVSEGQRVVAGQIIASVGNSGKSVIPHLHIHAGGLTDSGYMTIPLRFKACNGQGAATAPVLGKVVCD